MRAREFINIVTEQDDYYYRKVRGIESGDRNIQNRAGSRAFGYYQFVPKTFNSLVAQAKPGDPLYGKSWNQYQKSPEIQQAAMNALTQQNADILARSKIPVNDTSLYIAHLGGAGKAKSVYSNPDAPLKSIFSPEALKLNRLDGNAPASSLIASVDKKMAGFDKVQEPTRTASARPEPQTPKTEKPTTSPTQVAAAPSEPKTTGTQVASLPADLSKVDITKLTPAQIANITADQYAAMPASQVSQMNRAQLAALPFSTMFGAAAKELSQPKTKKKEGPNQEPSFDVGSAEIQQGLRDLEASRG